MVYLFYLQNLSDVTFCKSYVLSYSIQKAFPATNLPSILQITAFSSQTTLSLYQLPLYPFNLLSLLYLTMQFKSLSNIKFFARFALQNFFCNRPLQKSYSGNKLVLQNWKYTKNSKTNKKKHLITHNGYTLTLFVVLVVFFPINNNSKFFSFIPS